MKGSTIIQQIKRGASIIGLQSDIKVKMDFEYLDKLLNNIETKQEVTYNIADYIVTNSLNNENQVAKVLEKYFQSNFLKQKVAIFMVVNEIFLISAKQNDKRFFKALSQKAKGFLEELSMRYTELLPEYVFNITAILDRWFAPTRQLFVPAFTQKLRKVSEPIFDLAKKLEQQKRNGIFENYTKTFLMEYEDIQSYEPTSRIYNDFKKYDEIAKQIGEINQETKRLSLEHPTPEIKQRARILSERLESFNIKLQDLILLREACREEFERLPPEAKKVIEQNQS